MAGMASEVSDNITTHVDPFFEEKDIVSITVSGRIFETLKGTLNKYPSTLLGNDTKRNRYYVPRRKTLFFDRNHVAFEAILYYYQNGGTLIRPTSIPMTSFVEEVKFFEIGEEALQHLKSEEGYRVKDVVDVPRNTFQKRVWKLFEHPDSSIAARVVGVWSIFVIVLSILVFCFETLPAVRNSHLQNTSSIHSSFRAASFYLEIGCNGWFTFEYVMRLTSCPHKGKFLCSFMSFIDLLIILPYYVTLIIHFKDPSPLSLFRAVRLVRVFRIFKLSRYSLSLRILGDTLKASCRELAMLVFLLALGVILFSSAIYYCEEGVNPMFTSIPDAFWYCLVTMTTVGYGDKYPMTVQGKIVGSMCALAGVLTMAMPVPVIVSNFVFFYKRDRNQQGLGGGSEVCNVGAFSILTEGPSQKRCK